MAKPYRLNNLAIFAYGSLLSSPGEKILHHIVDRIPCPSPWPIEYARRSRLFGFSEADIGKPCVRECFYKNCPHHPSSMRQLAPNFLLGISKTRGIFLTFANVSAAHSQWREHLLAKRANSAINMSWHNSCGFEP
jgi:hypothetical protein